MINTYCDIAFWMTYSKSDTKETIDEILEHDARFAKTCPKQVPPGVFK